MLRECVWGGRSIKEIERLGLVGDKGTRKGVCIDLWGEW